MSSSARGRPHQRLREQTIDGRTGESADTHLTSSVFPFFVIRSVRLTFSTGLGGDR
jgi:hypothetical protein